MEIRKHFNMSIFLTICVIFLAAGIAQAGPGFGRGPGGCGGKNFYRMMKGLDLTEEQKAEIEEIRDNSRSRIEPLAEEIQELNIPELMLAEEIDVEAVKGAMARAQDLRCQIMAIRDEAKLSIAQVLTPEQRKELLEHIEQCRAGSGPGKGRGGRGGKGFRYGW